MSTSLWTLLRPQRGPHQGHNRKCMEVEGPCHVLLDHCELKEDNMILG